MYAEHFKLSGRPFNNCPGDGFFTPNEEFASAVTRMEQVLLSRDAVAVITGGPGVGKTTLVATAAKRVGDQAFVTYVDMRLASPDLLYDLLLLNLGEESGGGDQAASLYRLKSAIARHNDEQHHRITAVIDVSSLTIERAKKILQLVHMAGEPEGQLNVVLLGPHVLHKLLDTPGLIHMRQRVTFRYRARPLNVTETGAYLKLQLERSGGQADSILAQGTANVVYRFVGGVPRLINTLMDAVLGYAMEQDAETISAEMVTEVAQLLGWRRLGSSKSSGAKKRTATPAVASPMKTAGRKEEPSPLEVSAAKSATVEESRPETAPISEGTAVLMAAALDANTEPAAADKLELKTADSATDQDRAARNGKDQQSKLPGGVPEMDTVDTSATGMLRLEDLDARFAETVFGDETDILKLDSDTEKAAG